ncbi:MAG TPA: SDR family oxidoreductase, partial [Gemmataceae bacterium]|nr:SDR family oxidoreductase [Gemmataceae bacterium]
MDLTGRSAIITGASQGLGRAIAIEYVKAGANVLLIARDEKKLAKVADELKALALQGKGGIGIAAGGDVSKPEVCKAAVELAVKALPNLSILVNNAGIYGPMGRLEDVDWDDWVQAIEVNLYGPALMCKSIIPHFRKQKYGKIINLSGGGATAPLPGISAYAASKAAVVRLTETLAHELQDAKVDVNAIAPGPLNTRLLDEVIKAGPNRVGKDFYQKSLKQREEGGVPLEKGAA